MNACSSSMQKPPGSEQVARTRGPLMQQANTIDVDPASAALIVVDMQNDFCSPDGYYATVGRDVSKLAASAGPVAALVARARQAGMTIVFTRLLHDPVRGAMEDRR